MDLQHQELERRIEQQMPPGTSFGYLGRHCVVMHYADEDEQEHTGRYGLVFQYADAHGVIRQDCISPIDYRAFSKAVDIERDRVEPPLPHWGMVCDGKIRG